MDCLLRCTVDAQKNHETALIKRWNVAFMRLCGELGPGGGDSSSLSVESQDYMSYDDPGGNLLVWINLGGRRSTGLANKTMPFPFLLKLVDYILGFLIG